jgi:integrase
VAHRGQHEAARDQPSARRAYDQGRRARRTAAFSVKWIKEKLLAPGALDGLNQEARSILLAMVNTGCRPSELAGLLPHHIHLDGDTPHIEILPEGRQLKTAPSKRQVPLVGISLEAMKACPNGFPRYFGKDAVSAVINKFMKENGLLETDKHTLYSLRHSFEDRMLAAGIDERIRRDIFGHALDRERYGQGASLAHKRDLLTAISL